MKKAALFMMFLMLMIPICIAEEIDYTDQLMGRYFNQDVDTSDVRDYLASVLNVEELEGLDQEQIAELLRERMDQSFVQQYMNTNANYDDLIDQLSTTISSYSDSFSLNPQKACMDKYEEGEKWLKWLDNGVIDVLTKIALVIHGFCSTMNGIDTVISTVTTTIGFWKDPLTFEKCILTANIPGCVASEYTWDGWYNMYKPVFEKFCKPIEQGFCGSGLGWQGSWGGDSKDSGGSDDSTDSATPKKDSEKTSIDNRASSAKDATGGLATFFPLEWIQKTGEAFGLIKTGMGAIAEELAPDVQVTAPAPLTTTSNALTSASDVDEAAKAIREAMDSGDTSGLAGANTPPTPSPDTTSPETSSSSSSSPDWQDKGQEWGLLSKDLFNENWIDLSALGLGPYDNIYTAIICVSIPAILINLKKLKEIYITYNCCVEDACKHGGSIANCEKQLDVASCMYWEGSLFQSLYSILSNIVSNLLVKLMRNNVTKWLAEGKFGKFLITLLQVYRTYKAVMGLKSSLEMIMKSFDDLDCKDLDFEDYTQSDVGALEEQRLITMYDINGDGVLDQAEAEMLQEYVRQQQR